MLVTFSCPAHGEITMFGDVAIRLIRMMGHSGTVPSALLAGDVPAALRRLEAMAASGSETPEHEGAADGGDEEPPISLRQRAGPLLELLEAAKTARCNGMWRSG